MWLFCYLIMCITAHKFRGVIVWCGLRWSNIDCSPVSCCMHVTVLLGDVRWQHSRFACHHQSHQSTAGPTVWSLLPDDLWDHGRAYDSFTCGLFLLLYISGIVMMLCMRWHWQYLPIIATSTTNLKLLKLCRKYFVIFFQAPIRLFVEDVKLFCTATKSLTFNLTAKDTDLLISTINCSCFYSTNEDECECGLAMLAGVSIVCSISCNCQCAEGNTACEWLRVCTVCDVPIKWLIEMCMWDTYLTNATVKTMTELLLKSSCVRASLSVLMCL